jgi:hypothetical protein
VALPRLGPRAAKRGAPAEVQVAPDLAGGEDGTAGVELGATHRQPPHDGGDSSSDRAPTIGTGRGPLERPPVYQQASNAVHAIIKAVGLDALGRPRSNILVVSDHGMAPFQMAVALRNLLLAGGMTPQELSALRLQTSGPTANIYVNYGAHGHDSTLPTMSAILFAAGPDIQTGVTVPLVRNIDIASTIMQILDVLPASTVDGTALVDILLP